MKVLIANKSGVRIDKYLSEEENYSREYIQKLIKSGLILVNNQKVKASYMLENDDEIKIDYPTFDKEEIKATPISLDIVYEDDDLMVINKPSGLVVHPGSGNHDNTLVNALKAYTDKLSVIAGEERLGIVHRLDKDTSGLMLVAKTNRAHEILSEDFKYKRIKREYVALVKGIISEDSGSIDAPIGRDKNKREQMQVTALNSKRAITHFKVLKRYKDKCLISCVLETGRTHQIRVHMAYIGHPVFNDPVYDKEIIQGFGQFLHSRFIEFKHPITGKILSFSAPLPKIFADYLETLESEN